MIGAGKLREFVDLLVTSPDWMEAKFLVCQGDIAFVDDLDLAMKQYDDPLASDEIEIVIQLYLVRQIVNVRASVYTDSDFETLVWLNRKEEALNHARLRIDPYEKYMGLLTIYRATGESGRLDYIVRDEMLHALRNIDENETRQRLMIDCTKILRDFRDEQHSALFRDALFLETPTRAEEIFQLYQIANEINKHDGSDAFYMLVESLAKRLTTPNNESMDLLLQSLLKKGEGETVLTIARLLPNEQLVTDYVHWFYNSGNYAKAIESVQMITDSALQAETSIMLLTNFVQNNLKDETLDVLRVSKIKELAIILPIAVQFAETGYFETAKMIVDIAELSQSESWQVYQAMIFTMAQSDQFDLALKVSLEIEKYITMHDFKGLLG